MEREVTSKLEAGLSTLKGLSKLQSKSSAGQGSITLNFDKNAGMDAKRFEVATIIRQLYKKLPERVSYPSISLNRPDSDTYQQAFLSYSIDAPRSAFEIQEIVRHQIEPMVGALPAVDRTNVYGATQKEYLIRYDPDLLRQLLVSREDITLALKRYFAKERLGNVYLNDDYLTLAVKAPERTSWKIPIKKLEDRLLFLNDIATIETAEQEVQQYYRVNGQNAVTLNIFATKNANTISLAKKIEAQIQSLKKDLPPDLAIVQTYNSTEYLRSELNKIYERTAYTILILFSFILLLSRSFAYLCITVLSLIANLGGAFLFYHLFGVEIQLYSLAGITISLGLIIDNSIVMIDHLKKQGNQRAFIPILASTLTTIGALSIIYFLDDKYKVNLTDFALVMSINLGVSLLTALFLIPALMEKIPLKKHFEGKNSARRRENFYRNYEQLLQHLIRYKKTAITVALLSFGLPFFMLPKAFEKEDTFWKKAYNASLGSDLYQEEIRPYVDKYLGGSFRLFNKYVFSNAYYGKNEELKLMVGASMEKGASVHQMNEAFIELETFLEQFSEIKQYVTNIHSGDFGWMEISFHPAHENTAFPYLLKARLIRKALDLGGISWNISGVGNHFNNSNPSQDAVDFSVIAKGYHYDQLNRWADTLRYALMQHPRIKNVEVKENAMWSNGPRMGYRLQLDREQIALKKSNPSRIFAALQSHTLSKYEEVALNIRGNHMPVRLESQHAAGFDLWAVKNTPLDSTNNPILLKGQAKVYKEREDETIYKEDQEYTRLIEFQYSGSRKFGSQLLDEKIEEVQSALPLGYRFERPDDAWLLNRDQNNHYAFLLLMIISVIYFICAVLFESFRQPFIIISTIPISFIGVFLSFYLLDLNFDQGGLASLVLLSGITVNASIFILDSFNKMKKDHPAAPTLSLYLKAFQLKIFPILLTVLSTLLGFIPFVKDGQHEVFWFALGAGTISGLVFSLLGILVYLPLFTVKKSSLVGVKGRSLLSKYHLFH
jgi:multidrug efflux pump subunit AcrB